MFEFISAGFNELMGIVNRTDPQYIYLLLFTMAFIENIFPPLPGDTFTIIAGYLAAVGKLALIPTLAVILAGTMLSIMLVYGLGYRAGRKYFDRKNYRFFSGDDMDRVQKWFDRFGAGTLLASRFIVGARVAIAVGAGVSRYPTIPMAVYSFISSLLFHGALIALAFGLYAYIDSVSEGFGLYSKIVLVLVAALIILWIILIVRRYMHGKKDV